MIPYYSSIATRTDMWHAISFSNGKFLCAPFLPSYEVWGIRERVLICTILTFIWGTRNKRSMLRFQYHYITSILLPFAFQHCNFTHVKLWEWSPGCSSPNPSISFHFPFPVPPSPHHTKKQSHCQDTPSGMWQFPLSAKLFHIFNSEVKILS